jgi:nitrogen fixation/metabolism regulation signal transduction histidine kinase
MSKMVTRPLVALAEATHEISRGRLDYRVDVQAGNEIGQLVESFNHMAADLEASQGKIEASRRDLADVNVQLEQRTRHIETILESVPSGVLSLDASRHILHSNRAARGLTRTRLIPSRPCTTSFRKKPCPISSTCCAKPTAWEPRPARWTSSPRA